MSDQSTQYPQVYGFAPKRDHFIWRNPEEVQPAAPEPENERENDKERGQISLAEAVDAFRELGTTAPSVAKEVIRILTEEEQQPGPSTEPQTSQDASVSESTAIVVSSGSPASGVESNTQEAAPAIIEVGPRSPKSRRRKKRRTRAKKAEPAPPPKSRFARHQQQCGICGTDVQDEIDDAFINWEYVDQIADDYDIDRRAIYRHAHATGLFAKRDHNIRRALGRIIHEADRVTVTADSVVRAVKILTHVNAHGEWVQPPTHVIFSNATARPVNARAVEATPAIASQGDTPCKARNQLKR